MKAALLTIYRLVYEQVLRRLIFLSSAQTAHHRMLNLLTRLDRSRLLCGLLALIRRAVSSDCPVKVGGVSLPSRFIVAAGLVKGHGFATEAEALHAIAVGQNIIPGWRSLPALAGLVEFGSFTRHPRIGNSGNVVWRDAPSRSTQNRIGLRNPGAVAAAAFLAAHRSELPPIFGINIAASPGVTDPQQDIRDVCEAFSAFVEQDIRPAWFTLNLSCPNTEDDPSGRQTEDQTRHLCRAIMDYFHAQHITTPLWVKISPDLAPQQYDILLRVFDEVGVRAVIATNTLPHPAPTDAALTAGIGGGILHPHALNAVRHLTQETARQNHALDIIGCGGVLDGTGAQAFLNSGAAAVQYWSALIYRGPLAAAVIEREIQHGRTPPAGRPRPA